MPAKDVTVSAHDDLFQQMMEVSPFKRKTGIEISNNNQGSMQNLDPPFEMSNPNVNTQDEDEWNDEEGQDFSSSPTIPMDSPSMHNHTDAEQPPPFISHQFFVKTKSSYTDQPSPPSFRFSQVVFGKNTNSTNNKSVTNAISRQVSDVVDINRNQNKNSPKTNHSNFDANKNEKTKNSNTSINNATSASNNESGFTKAKMVTSVSAISISQSPNMADFSVTQKAEILEAIATGLTQYNTVLKEFKAEVQPRSDYLVTYLSKNGFNLKTKLVNDYLAEIRNDRLDNEVKCLLNNPNYTADVNELLLESNKRRKSYNKRKNNKNSLSNLNSIVNFKSQNIQFTELSSHPALQDQSLVPIAMATSKSTKSPDLNSQHKSSLKIKSKIKDREMGKGKLKSELIVRTNSEVEFPDIRKQPDVFNDGSKIEENKHGLRIKTLENTSDKYEENFFKHKSKPKTNSFSSTASSSAFRPSSVASPSSFCASITPPISTSLTFPSTTSKSSIQEFSSSFMEDDSKNSSIRALIPASNTRRPEMSDIAKSGNFSNSLRINLVKISTILNQSESDDSSSKPTLVSFVDLSNIDNFAIDKNKELVKNMLNSSAHLFKLISDPLLEPLKKNMNINDNKTFPINFSVTEIPISLNKTTDINLEIDQMISYIEVTLNISQFSKYLNYNSNSIKNGNFTSILQLKSITRVYANDQLIIKRCDPINASFVDDKRQAINVILPLQAKLWAGLINNYHNGICDKSYFDKLKISNTLLLNDDLLNFKNFKRPLHTFIWDFTTNTHKSNSYSLSNFSVGDLRALSSRPRLHTFNVASDKLENQTDAVISDNSPVDNQRSSPANENDFKIPLPTPAVTASSPKLLQKFQENNSMSTPSIIRHHSHFPAAQAFTNANSLRSKSEIYLQSKAASTSINNNVFNFPSHSHFNNALNKDVNISPDDHKTYNIPTIIAEDSELSSDCHSKEHAIGTTSSSSIRSHKRTRSRSMNEIDFMSLPLSFDGFVSMPFLDSFTPSDLAVSPTDNVINPTNKKQQNNTIGHDSSHSLTYNSFDFNNISTDTNNSTLLSDFKYLNNSDSQLELKTNGNPLLFDNGNSNTLDFGELSDISSHFTENNTPINTNQTVTSMINNLDVSQSFLVDSEISFSDNFPNHNDS